MIFSEIQLQRSILGLAYFMPPQRAHHFINGINAHQSVYNPELNVYLLTEGIKKREENFA